MIFNEIFSVYYSTVAKILSAAIGGKIPDRDMEKIITKNAFSESAPAIMPALKKGSWQLLNKDGTTPIKHNPSTPLTNMEKQWLKAISLDNRIKLFDVDFAGLEDMKPLFSPDDYCIFDSYGDGDDYTDPEYIKNFRFILHAVQKNTTLKITSRNTAGNIFSITALAEKLEYSEKDDKFRLICNQNGRYTAVNLGRIISVEKSRRPIQTTATPNHKRSVTITLTDERNALERVLLHFAHFEKKAVKTGDKTYEITFFYHSHDETEILIRILSFGPFIKVIAPQRFVDLIVSRLKRQKTVGKEL